MHNCNYKTLSAFNFNIYSVTKIDTLIVGTIDGYKMFCEAEQCGETQASKQELRAPSKLMVMQQKVRYKF